MSRGVSNEKDFGIDKAERCRMRVLDLDCHLLLLNEHLVTNRPAVMNVVATV